MKNLRFFILCIFTAFSLPCTYGSCAGGGGGGDESDGIVYSGLVNPAEINILSLMTRANRF